MTTFISARSTARSTTMQQPRTIGGAAAGGGAGRPCARARRDKCRHRSTPHIMESADFISGMKQFDIELEATMVRFPQLLWRHYHAKLYCLALGRKMTCKYAPTPSTTYTIFFTAAFKAIFVACRSAGRHYDRYGIGINASFHAHRFRRQYKIIIAKLVPAAPPGFMICSLRRDRQMSAGIPRHARRKRRRCFHARFGRRAIGDIIDAIGVRHASFRHDARRSANIFAI